MAVLASLALKINPNDPIMIGDFWGFVLSLLFAPFLVFWLSAVKKRAAVVIGAIIGSVVAFLIILGWAGTLIFDTSLSNAGGAPVFFGSMIFCTIVAIIFGMLTDLLVARFNNRDYRRQVSHE